MKFGEDDKIKDWHLLSKDEAWAYVTFLLVEKKRHINNIDEAEVVIALYKSSENPRGTALVELFESAIRRHRKDIEGINGLVIMVKHWFSL